MWAVAGGGILTLTPGQILLGFMLIAFALVRLVLSVTGRILKYRDYTRQISSIYSARLSASFQMRQYILLFFPSA